MHERLAASLLFVCVSWMDCCFASGAGGNLILNPYFDTDLTAWTPSSDGAVQWTSAEDHYADGSGGAGSVSVMAPLTSAYVYQCVSVNHNMRYVLRVWALSQCGNDAELQLFWGDKDCNVGVANVSVTSDRAKTWQQLELAAATPTSTDRYITAVVVLNNSGACHDNAYFDDVVLEQDEIFEEDFDSSKF